MSKLNVALITSILSLVFSGCGSTSELQSISINAAAATAAPKFSASGTLTNGKNIIPLPVSWMIVGPGIDPPGAGHSYSLSAAPFFPVCVLSGGSYTVVAIAPADPQAPVSGTVPDNVWNDLLSGRVKSEGGFVGATTQLTCA